MNEIELWNGSTKALIDPIGAWLTNLSDDYGDILYPKRNLTNDIGEKKTRGGSHICLPNFGPGGESGQPQHGFGREMIWTISDQQASSVKLELPAGKDEYEPLYSMLEYTLGETSITVKLTVENRGDTPLRVAPAFHPYFALNPGEGQVLLNGMAHDIQDLAATEFFDDEQTMDLHVERRSLEIISENLSTWAFWTDQLGDYVCCEPTVGGYTFLNKPAKNELLEPGKSASFSMTISW